MVKVEIIDKFIEFVSAFGMALLAFACVWQVFTRYVLNSPNLYTEEFMRYGLIWVTMLVSPYAYSKGKQLAIHLAVQRFSLSVQHFIQIGVSVCMIAFAVFIFIFGGIRVSENAIGQVSAAMQIPMEYIYCSLIVSGVLFVIYCTIDIKKQIALIKNEKTGEV